MKINMQKQVETIMLRHSSTRDCDPYLLYYVWKSELKNVNYESNYPIDIDSISLTGFLKLWRDKQISHPSAIMRARRKVQEHNPKTRGDVWDKRHSKQKDVQKQLGYNV